ncbi:MAG: hypothetical protein GX635_01820 [Synergistaceae bacterium]|nr:hypothetical protein [Synergistaceae bacterium]
MIEWAWKTRDPRGKTVVLKASTLNEHIIGDHDDADSGGRIAASALVPLIAEAPRYIVKDLSPIGSDRRREKYFDVRHIEATGKFSYVVLVVDTDREPYEVVTWMIQRRMTDIVPKEGVLYDSSQHRERKS